MAAVRSHPMSSKLDTLTSQEQAFNKLVAAKSQPVNQALFNMALELKPKIKSQNFVVQPEWRDEFFAQLQKAGVTVTRAQYDSVSPYIDRVIAARVARAAYGDSTVKRRDLDVDLQLKKATDLLAHSQTQKDLFTEAQQMAAADPVKGGSR
jgi:hypothetical protein